MSPTRRGTPYNKLLLVIGGWVEDGEGKYQLFRITTNAFPKSELLKTLTPALLYTCAVDKCFVTAVKELSLSKCLNQFMYQPADKFQVQEPNERLLLMRVADGDRVAFAVLYKRHMPLLYQYVYRFSKQSKTLSDEIVQEVFITIWEKKETLIGIQSFSAFAYKIAKNKLLNSLKKEATTQKLHEQLASLQPQFDSGLEKGLVFADYHQSALRAIELLPEKRKQIFLLSTQYELTLDEIADQMQVSKSRVKQQLLKAKNYIKEYLTNHAEWLVMLLLASGI